MIDFLQPENLYAAWLLLPLAIVLAWALRALYRARRRLGGAGLSHTSRPTSLLRRFLQSAAALAVAACLVLALARPQTVSERRVAEMRRMDIVVLLDMSPSMRARDIAPSRLYEATEVIDEFIQKKLPEDRFGLVSFADNALVLSYLTADPSNMMFYLDYLRKDTGLQYGTNIGGALRSGIQVVSRQQEIEPQAAKNKRVFVLLSDGEDQGEELEDQIAQTVQRNIPVYCVGIGSREGAYIPIGERDGKTEYLTGKEGRRILTTFNEETLRRVAEKTGGRYYRARTGMEMSQAFADIFLKTREVESYHRVREPRERYPVLLAAAFGLFLLRVLI